MYMPWSGRHRYLSIAARRAAATSAQRADGEVVQVAFVAVQQTVQIHRRVVVGGTAERAHAEAGVEARLAHRAVAEVVVGAQAIALRPGAGADFRGGDVATGFPQPRDLRRIRVLGRLHQIARIVGRDRHAARVAAGQREAWQETGCPVPFDGCMLCALPAGTAMHGTCAGRDCPGQRRSSAGENDACVLEKALRDRS
ncbi:MAG: hypothetical protein WBG81_03400 [Rhodanobacter sp.]|uniref:hypothetical protein n=1 Tax=Rhodanobacter sp. KK11 TaxID=3083255 RepID=UPI0031BBCA6C